MSSGGRVPLVAHFPFASRIELEVILDFRRSPTALSEFIFAEVPPENREARQEIITLGLNAQKERRTQCRVQQSLDTYLNVLTRNHPDCAET